MKIKVLGTGCRNCLALEKELISALAELDVSADVEKIEDMNRIGDYDVFLTPGLVINGKVKVSGKVPNREVIKKMILEEQ